jgi:hypothetical protein
MSGLPFEKVSQLISIMYARQTVSVFYRANKNQNSDLQPSIFHAIIQYLKALVELYTQRRIFHQK